MSDTLRKSGITKPLYVDIGAHHPIFANNTYLLYRQGGRGILVEPNKELCYVIQNTRPRDVCLNAGVGGHDSEEEFFSFPRSTRSTFSKVQAEAWQRESEERPTIEKKPIYSLDTIINTHCDRVPDVVSIDAEGLDIEILSGFSWTRRPKIFCIESAVYDDGGIKHVDSELASLMKQHDYTLVAKVLCNDIFVDVRSSQSL